MKLHRPPVPVDATHVRDGGRLLWNASGCNYLGLLHHPALLEAMASAVREGPFHTGASRATTGEHRRYIEAERLLARFLRLEAAVLLPTGYMASLAAMQALASHATHVAIHPAAHACLRDGALLSGLGPVAGWDGTPEGWAGCKRRVPPRSRVVMAMDGVAPAGGHVADLPGCLAGLPRDGWLLVDDAHGVGVLGRRGSGTAEHHGIDDPRVVVTGSLAKAMGLQGGFVAGPAAVVASARESAAFVGSTAPPMAMAAGLHAALRVLRREPGRIRALQERAAWFHGRVCDIPGIRSHPASPVVALHPGTRARARRLAGDLSKAGIHPPFIRYPSGPRDGFFRFALNALHAWDDLERLVGVIRGCAGAGRPDGGRGT